MGTKGYLMLTEEEFQQDVNDKYKKISQLVVGDCQDADGGVNIRTSVNALAHVAGFLVGIAPEESRAALVREIHAAIEASMHSAILEMMVTTDEVKH